VPAASAAPGVYEATLTVSDGALDASETVTIRVAPLEPQGWLTSGEVGRTRVGSRLHPSPDGSVRGVRGDCRDREPVRPLGDVDGDGRLDLVSVAGTQLRVRYGNTAKADAVATLSWSASEVVLEDLVGTSAAEILVGSSGVLATQVSVYQGDGALWKTVTSRGGLGDPAGYRMLPVAYAGDGKLLVAYGSGPETDLRGYAAFDLAGDAELWHYDVGPGIASVAVADADADGMLELLASVWTPADGVSAHGPRTRHWPRSSWGPTGWSG